MSTNLIQTGLIERNGVKSGAIVPKQEGISFQDPRTRNFPGFGVIFATVEENRDAQSESGKDNPDGFTAEDFLGTRFFNRFDPASHPQFCSACGDANNQERVYEVIGGYYLHYEGSDKKGRVSHVFGILENNADFGIENNGSKILADDWMGELRSCEMEAGQAFDDVGSSSGAARESKLVSLINENLHTREAGWTLIVVENPNNIRPRSLYPPSGRPLSIVCPKVKTFSADGKCIKVDKGGRPQVALEVTFNLEVEGSIDSWRLDFGDGSTPESGRNKPQAEVKHIYDSIPTTAPSLLINGNHGCELIEISIPLEEFDKMPSCACPQTIPSTSIGPCSMHDGVRKREVIFDIPQPEPSASSWKLVFGDGTEDSGVGNPPEKIIHHYASPPQGRTLLFLHGGDICNEMPPISIRLDRARLQLPTIPEITTVLDRAISRDRTGVNVRMQASGNIQEGTSLQCEWNFGDNTTPLRAGTEVTHHYELEIGKRQDFKVTVTPVVEDELLTGCAQVFSFECPVENPCVELKIEKSLVEHDNETETYEFTLKVDSKLPEVIEPIMVAWDFGDTNLLDAQAFSSGRTVRHTYQRSDDNQTFIVNADCTGIGDSCSNPVPVRLNVGTCPDIRLSYTGELTDAGYTVTFEAIAEGEEEPDTYAWDFDDGTLIPSGDARQVHTYALKPGEPKTFDVTVTSSGPEGCSVTQKIPVPIPPLCPLRPTLEKVVLDQENADSQTIKFKIVLANEVIPENIVWSFGDGTIINTNGTELEQTHTFKPSYASEQGQSKNFLILIRVSGPGECEDFIIGDNVELPCPPCPVIREIRHEVLENNKQLQRVQFTVVSDELDKQQIEWEAHEAGKTENSIAPVSVDNEVAVFELPHAPMGTEAITYQIHARSSGPDQCASEMEIEFESGICPCPEVKIEMDLIKETDSQSEYRFRAIHDGPASTQYFWDFGDGSTQEPNSDTVIHTYTKSSAKTKFEVKLRTAGPGDCSAVASLDVPVPPPVCPVIEAVACQQIIPVDENTVEVLFEVVLEERSPEPDNFTWDWGDGLYGPQTGKIATHHYDLPKGEDTVRNIMVTAYGPGECQTSRPARVDLKGTEEPAWWCRLFPCLPVFFAALTVCMLIVNRAIGNENIDAGSMPSLVLGIAFVGFLVTAFLWFILGKKGKCPMDLCGWLAIGWGAGLAGASVAYMLSGDCGEIGDFWVLLPFVIGMICVILWFFRCYAKSGGIVRFLMLLGCAALAVIISYFGIARTILDCF